MVNFSGQIREGFWAKISRQISDFFSPGSKALKIPSPVVKKKQQGIWPWMGGIAALIAGLGAGALLHKNWGRIFGKEIKPPKPASESASSKPPSGWEAEKAALLQDKKALEQEKDTAIREKDAVERAKTEIEDQKAAAESLANRRQQEKDAALREKDAVERAKTEVEDQKAAAESLANRRQQEKDAAIRAKDELVAEKDELKASKQALMDDCNALREALGRKEQELQALTAGFEREKTSFRQENQDLTSKIAGLESEKQATVLDRDSLQAQLTQKEERIGTLQASLLAGGSKNAEKIAELTGQKEDLKNQLHAKDADLTTRQVEIDALKQSQSALAAQLAAKENAHITQVAELDRQIRESKSNLEQAGDALIRASDAKQRLKNEKATLESQLTEQAKAHDLLRTEQQEEIRRLETERDAINSQKLAVEEAAQSKNAEAQGQIPALLEAKTAAENHAQALSLQLNDLTKAHTEVEANLAQLQQRHQQTQQLQTVLSDKNSEWETLHGTNTSRINELETAIGLAENAKRSLADQKSLLESQLSIMEHEKERLKEELERAQSQVAGTTTAKEEAMGLLGNATAEIGILRQNLGEAQAKARQLEVDIEAQQGESSALTRELLEAHESIEALQGQISRLKGKEVDVPGVQDTSPQAHELPVFGMPSASAAVATQRAPLLPQEFNPETFLPEEAAIEIPSSASRAVSLHEVAPPQSPNAATIGIKADPDPVTDPSVPTVQAIRTTEPGTQPANVQHGLPVSFSDSVPEHLDGSPLNAGQGPSIEPSHPAEGVTSRLSSPVAALSAERAQPVSDPVDEMPEPGVGSAKDVSTAQIADEAAVQDTAVKERRMINPPVWTDLDDCPIHIEYKYPEYKDDAERQEKLLFDSAEDLHKFLRKQESRQFRVHLLLREIVPIAYTGDPISAQKNVREFLRQKYNDSLKPQSRYEGDTARFAIRQVEKYLNGKDGPFYDAVEGDFSSAAKTNPGASGGTITHKPASSREDVLPTSPEPVSASATVSAATAAGPPVQEAVATTAKAVVPSSGESKGKGIVSSQGESLEGIPEGKGVTPTASSSRAPSIISPQEDPITLTKAEPAMESGPHWETDEACPIQVPSKQRQAVVSQHLRELVAIAFAYDNRDTAFGELRRALLGKTQTTRNHDPKLLTTSEYNKIEGYFLAPGGRFHGIKLKSPENTGEMPPHMKEQPATELDSPPTAPIAGNVMPPKAPPHFFQSAGSVRPDSVDPSSAAQRRPQGSPLPIYGQGGVATRTNPASSSAPNRKLQPPPSQQTGQGTGGQVFSSAPVAGKGNVTPPKPPPALQKKASTEHPWTGYYREGDRKPEPPPSIHNTRPQGFGGQAFSSAPVAGNVRPPEPPLPPHSGLAEHSLHDRDYALNSYNRIRTEKDGELVAGEKYSFDGSPTVHTLNQFTESDLEVENFGTAYQTRLDILSAIDAERQALERSNPGNRPYILKRIETVDWQNTASLDDRGSFYQPDASNSSNTGTRAVEQKPRKRWFGFGRDR